MRRFGSEWDIGQALPQPAPEPAATLTLYFSGYRDISMNNLDYLSVNK
jgi:hypothetical protein